MNLISSMVFVFCSYQIFVSSNANDDIEYNLNNLKYDVETINQTVQQYKESIFLLLAENYESMERKLLSTFKNMTHSKVTQLKIQYGIKNMEDVEEPLKSCFANRSITWSTRYIQIIGKLRECATNNEIEYYMIPIQSYCEFFTNTLNNLESGVKEKIFANYEKKNYSEILTNEHYMKLKSSELSILVNGLKSLSNNLIKLLMNTKQSVLRETQHCASDAKNNLNKQCLESIQQLDDCFSHIKNNKNNRGV
ncbi:uncharacterized protein LOC127283201 [Leptopilina boulardi]|uniref:uncharacterized protein LOC127283201 n=1 Tax=Leptopilina boulardi TaxID=63433 RepID=UPI0021F5192E|nr:uncharacterized protein LOC127283201 [Leptopilina boulardi]